MTTTPVTAPRMTAPLAARLAACAALCLMPLLAAPAAHAQDEGGATAEVPADGKPKPRKAPPKPKPETRASESRTAEAKPRTEGAVLEPAAAETRAVWPNGARTVSEAYGDWTMNCNRENGRTDCVVIQSQGDRRTGRRQFSVELKVPQNGRAEGLILMPFGMQIEPGVSFRLDDRAMGKGAPYSYCVSDGCLVQISLPTLATDTMKTAQTMQVSGMKPDAKEPTVISVPLTGFAAAFARAIAYGG